MVLPARNVVRALVVVERESGEVLAPHVAAQFLSMRPRSNRDLLELSGALTSAQLAGRSMLPDPLPLSAALIEDSERLLKDLPTTGRDVLLAAALCRTDEVGVVLDASNADPAELLKPPMTRLIRVHDGRFHLTYEALRTMLVHTASAAALAATHSALAAALRARGLDEISIWHEHAADPTSSGVTAERLLALGEQLLAAGSVHAAFHVAHSHLVHRPCEEHASARLLAGRAALMAGCLHDARHSLDSPGVASAGVVSAEQEGRRALAAVASLVDGPPQNPEWLVRIGAQMMVLQAASESPADRRVTTQLIDFISTWYDDRDEADAIHSRTFLATPRAPARWPWTTTTGQISPLIEACLHAQHVGLQIDHGDLQGAADSLTDGLIRLPMTHVSGGAMASAAQVLGRRVESFHPAFGRVLNALAPTSVVEPNLPAHSHPSTSVLVAAAAGIRTPADANDPGAEVKTLRAMTGREREVLALVADGLSNRDIGERLAISARTVEVHLGKIYRKLHVRSRAQLLAMLDHHM